MSVLAQKRIEQAGRRLLWLNRVLVAGAAVTVVWALAREGPAALLAVPPPFGIDRAALTLPGSVAVVAVGLIHPASFVIALLFLDRLFRLYSRGVVFSRANTVAIRRTGYALVAIDVARTVQAALTGPVLMVTGALGGSGPHKAFLSVELTVSMLMVGLVTVLISHVMEMGRQLQEDEKLTI